MGNKKHVILWCWWYDRQDLMTPLLPVMAEAENHFLFYRFPEQEKLDFELPGKRHYWTEYKTPYNVINDLRPDKVVFMGIESMLTIALRSACRKKGIKTFYLTHGLTMAYSKTAENERSVIHERLDERFKKDSAYYTRNKNHSLYFFLHAFSRAPLVEKAFLIKFALKTKSIPRLHERLYHCQSHWRLADKYIVITKHLGRLMVERDGVKDDRIIEVGPYTLDYLFNALREYKGGQPGMQPYFLLIDQPLAMITEEAQNKFFNNLADTLSSMGYQLKVKLHPRKYKLADATRHANISWVRDEIPLDDLIMNASACLGYFSTLLLPVIWFKPCGIFNPSNNILADEWIEMGVVKKLEFGNVKKEDLLDVLREGATFNKEGFKQKYLFQVDGKGVERIGNVLLEKKQEEIN